MNGYLLDNNVISVAGRRSDARYSNVANLINGIGSSPIFLPVIALAEIEFGMEKVQRPVPDLLRDELKKFFFLYDILPFDENTIEPYSKIRARLWREFGTPKKNNRGHEEQWVEQLPFVKSLGADLKIDERDLQIVSISVQHEIILVTNDTNEGMSRIDRVGKLLLSEGKLPWFCIEYWNFQTGMATKCPEST